jgi:hypothetical protein
MEFGLNFSSESILIFNFNIDDAILKVDRPLAKSDNFKPFLRQLSLVSFMLAISIAIDLVEL